jgi:hypothetical protein
MTVDSPSSDISEIVEHFETPFGPVTARLLIDKSRNYASTFRIDTWSSTTGELAVRYWPFIGSKAIGDFLYIWTEFEIFRIGQDGQPDLFFRPEFPLGTIYGFEGTVVVVEELTVTLLTEVGIACELPVWDVVLGSRMDGDTLQIEVFDDGRYGNGEKNGEIPMARINIQVNRLASDGLPVLVPNHDLIGDIGFDHNLKRRLHHLLEATSIILSPE